MVEIIICKYDFKKKKEVRDMIMYQIEQLCNKVDSRYDFVNIRLNINAKKESKYL